MSSEVNGSFWEEVLDKLPRVFHHEPFFHGNGVEHHHEVECQVDVVIFFVYSSTYSVKCSRMNLIHRIFAFLMSIALSSPVWTFCFLAF